MSLFPNFSEKIHQFNYFKQQEKKQRRNIFIFSAVAGFVGAITALLLSPKSGKENRSYIIKKGKTAGKAIGAAEHKLEDKLEDIKENLEEKFEHLKKKFEDKKETVSKKGKSGKKLVLEKIEEEKKEK